MNHILQILLRMIKIKGVFEKYETHGKTLCYLMIDLPDIYYQQVKSHVINSMFLSVKRIAHMYRKVLISSIGDHIDKNGTQNLLKADVCIDVTIDSVDQQLVDIMSNDPLWSICVINRQNRDIKFLISIDKENDMIISRTELTK